MEYIEVCSNNFNKQKWQLKNLNVVHFANGDLIQQVHTKAEKEHAVNNHIPAWCLNEDDPNGIEKLYNIYAINDARGLLTDDLRLPNNSDFEVLETHLTNNKNNYEIFTLTHGLSLWSCSKLYHNKTYVFIIGKDYCGYIFSMGKDYHSVRGIKSTDKYLLDLEPELKSEDKQKILLNNLKGDALFESGNIKDAIEIYKELIPLCMNDPELYFKIGKAYLAYDNTISESLALEYLKKSIFLDPTRSETFYYAGIASVSKAFGASLAEPYFDTAIKLNAKPEYYLARAEEREKVLNFEGFIEDIEKANLEVIPTKYYEYRANLKERKGDYLGAISEYDILISKYENYGLFYYNRGRLKTGIDNSSAIKDFIKASELYPEVNTDSFFLADYGNVLYLNGNLTEALERLNDSILIHEKIDLFPCNQYYLRASCLHDLGRNEEALNDIEKTTDEFLIVPSYLILRIKILIELCLYEDALEVLKELKNHNEASIDTSNISLYYFLNGEVYLKTNNQALAYENYKKAGDLGYKDGYQQIVKNNLTESKSNLTTENKKVDNGVLLTNKTNSNSNTHQYLGYSYQKEKYLKVCKELLNEDEYQRVIDKVKSSESLKKFIDTCRIQKILPKADVFVKQVCHSRAFMFVFNYNKIDVACIELFDMWIREVNARYNLVHEESLIYILQDILKSSNKLATGK